MSHIPAHAMPHAARHHHDAPPAEPTQPEAEAMTTEPAQPEAEAMTMEPSATAVSTDPAPAATVPEAAPAPVEAPATATATEQSDAASDAKPASSRAKWNTTALAAGVALIAGLVTVGVPLLRGRQRKA